ncbi:Hypothetical protein A7982_04454 [Minicystis rosea]|nr:Hypothetical protein A7982_04454 [Minicystis rosea]
MKRPTRAPCALHHGSSGCCGDPRTRDRTMLLATESAIGRRAFRRSKGARRGVRCR